MLKKIFFTLLLASSTLLANYQAPMTIEGSTTIDSKKAVELYNKRVVFLDVRPYWMVKKQGKIRGAVNLYVRDISQNSIKKVLPSKGTEVVIYCNGVGCSLSEEAIVKIRPYGYKNIYFYRNGYPAWKYFNLPIEQ